MSTSPDSTANQEAVEPSNLGATRWVHFAYVMFALGLLWLLRHLIYAVWNIWREPSDVYVTGGALVASVATTAIAYKHPRVHQWSQEVVAELSRVTWPSRRETWSSTVVVVITSIVASLILFGFDAAWSSLTDLVYEV